MGGPTMATVAALPSTLRCQVLDAAKHIRRLSLISCVILLVLLLVLTAGAAIGTDVIFDLPMLARIAVQAGWIVLGSILAFRCIILPLQRNLPPAQLAALVEEKYPDL